MTAHPFVAAVDRIEVGQRVGLVRKVSAGRIVATGPLATVGDLCEISSPERRGVADLGPILAQVVAVEESHIILIPLDTSRSVYPDAVVKLLPSHSLAPVGDAFAGRAVSGLAHPIDQGPEILADDRAPISGRVLQPMERQEPNAVLETGIRAIDGLLSIGRGQRVGIFAASGVGKTTLVRQLSEQVECDRCVVCLVGERGREVEALWSALSASPRRDRSTCVAATSDVSAPIRARAVYQALALAEYWRDRGEDVLLVVDSVTRYAMALREIGLAAGAPPTLRAYTPNVFAALPRIVERCGGRKAGGSITAIMTVLSESDDVDDPIVEVMKSLLDGHVILSRQLAEQGHFPAIDVPRSVSRLSDQIVTEAHKHATRSAISRLATYEEARVMIETGIYKTGANAQIDDALATRKALQAYLQQASDDRSPLTDSIAKLKALAAKGGAHAA